MDTIRTRPCRCPIPVHDGTYESWKERSEYFEQIRARHGGDAASGLGGHLDQRDAAREREANKNRNHGRPAIREAGGAACNFISPEYFPVLRIPLSQGRLWDHAETMRGAQVAVINQTMARQYWPKGDAIGRQFRIPDLKDEPPYQPAATGSDGWLQIVGVVADARNDGLRNPIKPAVYVPYSLRMRMFTQILVRTRVPPLSMLNAFARELVQIDKEQQVMRVQDLEAWITDMREYAQQRLVARLFAIFSVLALLLAAAGLYSVVSTAWPADQRIRDSRGAGRRRRGMSCGWCLHHLVECGRRIGGGAGNESGLRQVSAEVAGREFARPHDFGRRGITAARRRGIGLLGPARRAASVEPSEALRYE